jgi:hypothetical protein
MQTVQALKMTTAGFIPTFVGGASGPKAAKFKKTTITS